MWKCRLHDRLLKLWHDLSLRNRVKLRYNFQLWNCQLLQHGLCNNLLQHRLCHNVLQHWLCNDSMQHRVCDKDGMSAGIMHGNLRNVLCARSLLFHSVLLHDSDLRLHGNSVCLRRMQHRLQ